jgi:hypothetical protein
MQGLPRTCKRPGQASNHPHFKAAFFKSFFGLQQDWRTFLRVRVRIAEIFWTNFFACGKPELSSTVFLVLPVTSQRAEQVSGWPVPRPVLTIGSALEKRGVETQHVWYLQLPFAQHCSWNPDEACVLHLAVPGLEAHLTLHLNLATLSLSKCKHILSSLILLLSKIAFNAHSNKEAIFHKL